jgi:hypothetical protein
MSIISIPKVRLASPYIRYFQIVAEIIEQNITALMKRTGKNRGQICAEIRSQYDHCLEEWFAGREPQMDYHDPVCRLAYLYGVVPATASVVETAFANDEELSKYFLKVAKKKGSVSVCAFGGGPGTELLAIAKWVERCNLRQPVSLDYLLLDRANEWLDSWKGIKKQIELRFAKYIGTDRQTWPVVVSSGFFSAVDIKSIAGSANVGSIFDQDLYVLSYLISEIFNNFGNLGNLTAQIAESAPSGAKFLFVDRKGNCWKNAIRTVAEQAGITLSDFHDTNDSMDPLTEESSDLGTLKQEIGKAPKLRWSAFWVVGTKK